MQKVKNILICPLEWGLGHAGRMIPVAIKLRETGHNVFIGSGQKHLDFFSKEIPGISCIYFPGFKIKYSSWIPQYIVIFFTTPLFIFRCIQEHQRLKKIINDYKIDIVISDSRIGLWNKNISTALVTHMIRIPHPKLLRFLEESGNPVVKKVTGRFDYCLIPDLPGDVNLSGKLSHAVNLPANARYIGILSRFKLTADDVSLITKKYYCTVILSGPEPQRSILRDKMTQILAPLEKPSVILEGNPSGDISSYRKGSITYIPHLTTEEFRQLIHESEYIVTRSGYTSVMELVSLNKSALLIPTPGQSEQEYLAEYLSGKGWFKTMEQNELSVETKLSSGEINIPSGLKDESEFLLDKALNELLEK